MIKFFRNIRQNLIMENKTSKYFKYAIGEIVLVVIGILIALQINNWNNNRIDLKKEQFFLLNLQSDFKENLKEYQNTYNSTLESYRSCGVLLNIIKEKKDSINPTQIDSLIYQIINNFGSLDLISGTIDELINSGSLYLIRDTKLRKQLSNWSQKILDTEDDIIIANDYMFNLFLPSLKNKFLLRNTDIPENIKKNIGVPKISKSSFNLDYKLALNNVEFENELFINTLNIAYALDTYKTLANYIEETLILIENNIE